MTALNNVKVIGSCFYKFMKITAQMYTSISKQIPAGRLCQMSIQVVRQNKELQINSLRADARKL
jgi:hypothetical protein